MASPDQAINSQDLRRVRPDAPKHCHIYKHMIADHESGSTNRVQDVNALKIGLIWAIGSKRDPSPIKPNIYVDQNGKQKQQLVEPLESLIVQQDQQTNMHLCREKAH